MQLKNKLLIVALSLAATIANASDQDQLNNQQPPIENFKHWVISTSMGPASGRMTDKNINKWRINEDIGLQYYYSPYIFAGATLDIMDNHTLGYKLNSGVQLPLDYVTPYVEIYYNDAHTVNGVHKETDSIDYAVGSTVSIPQLRGVSFLAELKDPIKNDESMRFGVGYNITDSVSVDVDFWTGLDNKSNGSDVELDYAFN